MDRQSKHTLVAELKTMFNSNTAAIVVDYRGMENNKVTDLRKQLTKASAKMRVIKNTLAKIAADGTPLDCIKDQFTETRALILGNNPVQQAKVVVEFAKGNDKLQIVSGLYLDGGKASILNKTDLEALSKLPSREELIAKILFILNAPITQFVRTLNEVPASFVRALSAVADSKNQQS